MRTARRMRKHGSQHQRPPFDEVDCLLRTARRMREHGGQHQWTQPGRPDCLGVRVGGDAQRGACACSPEHEGAPPSAGPAPGAAWCASLAHLHVPRPRSASHADRVVDFLSSSLVCIAGPPACAQAMFSQSRRQGHGYYVQQLGVHRWPACVRSGQDSPVIQAESWVLYTAAQLHPCKQAVGCPLADLSQARQHLTGR